MSRVFSVQFTPGQDHEFLSGGWDDTVQVRHASLMPAFRYRARKKSLLGQADFLPGQVAFKLTGPMGKSLSKSSSNYM